MDHNQIHFFLLVHLRYVLLFFQLNKLTFYLKKAAGKEKGSSEPGRSVEGSVKISQIKEIAENKMKDLNAANIDGAIEMVKGSARSMGLEVVE